MHPPCRVITPTVDLTLTGEWREYAAELAATASEANAKLNITVGYGKVVSDNSALMWETLGQGQGDDRQPTNEAVIGFGG